MSRISAILLASLLIACTGKEQESKDLTQVYNCILDYEIRLIAPCQQYWGDSLAYEEIPAGLAVQAFPPFDSLNCAKVISNNLTIVEEFLTSHCVAVRVELPQLDRIPWVNATAIQRAEAFLGAARQADIELDVTQLNISMAGIEVVDDPGSCKREFVDVYRFSPVFLNADNDRAVVFVKIYSHAEDEAAYYFRRLGRVWYLEVKERLG